MNSILCPKCNHEFSNEKGSSVTIDDRADTNLDKLPIVDVIICDHCTVLLLEFLRAA